MKLINKQPIFEAEQFDGSEASVNRLHSLIGMYAVEGWQLTNPSIGKPQIVFKVHGKADITLTKGEWLLRAPDGTKTVVDDEYLEEKFDKVPPSLGAGAIKIVDQGTSVGFGRDVLGTVNSDKWRVV
jgi:hypothetical protein